MSAAIEETGQGIEFRDVVKSFGHGSKAVDVIDGASFSIREGEFVCVLGPSGCGKSTLMSMAAGFMAPDGGEVLVDGSVVRGPSHTRGVVFQQYAIFPWLSVEENIGFGLKLRAGRRSKEVRQEIVARYVKLMGLQGFEKALPKTLSGGMRQRVAIARAYATNPEVLLMDEPFAALDAQTREFMQELLADIQQQERKTVLFITHSVEEAIFLSHRVVVMSGRPSQVRTIVDIDIPFPRQPETRLSPGFLSLRRDLEELMRSMSSLTGFGSRS